jgi:hypothetical protein
VDQWVFLARLCLLGSLALLLLVLVLVYQLVLVQARL